MIITIISTGNRRRKLAVKSTLQAAGRSGQSGISAGAVASFGIINATGVQQHQQEHYRRRQGEEGRFLPPAFRCRRTQSRRRRRNAPLRAERAAAIESTERAINLMAVAFHPAELASPPTPPTLSPWWKLSEKTKPGTAGRRCLTPQQVNLSPALHRQVGASIKCVGSFSHAERDTHQRGAQNSHKIAPGTFTRLQGYRQTGRTAPPAPGGESPKHQGVGFHWPSTSPALRDRTATNQADGGRQSQLDRLRGTERVTTSRRPSGSSR